MSDENTQEGRPGQESGANQGQGGQGQESAADQGQPGQESGANQGTQTGTFDPSTITDPAMKAWAEKVEKDAKEARDQAARYRTERNQAQAQVTDFQRQNETDAERATRENQERQERLENLERENRDLKVGGAIHKAATAMKAHDPDTVMALITANVELDDKGNPVNLQTLLTDLKRSKPFLFKTGGADAGEGTGDSALTGGTMNDLIRGAARARKGLSS